MKNPNKLKYGTNRRLLLYRNVHRVDRLTRFEQLLVSPDEGLFESRNLLFSQIVNFEFFKTVDVSSSVPTSSLIFNCQLRTHFDAEFQFSSCYPDQLRQIFDNFCKKISEFFKKTLQLSSFYPDGLRQIFDLFQGKFKIFLKKIQNFPNLKIFLNRASQKATLIEI
jgi:hypothetical protein